MNRDRQVLEDRVREHWTPERLAQLTRGTQRLLLPTDAPHLLRALGILDAGGRLQARRERKYRQINHLLSFLRPALEQLAASLPPDRSLHVLDAGCGRSALGFLVAWWFHRKTPHSIRVHGVDRNPDAIAGCRERAALLGLEGLTFAVQDLGDVRADPARTLTPLDGRVDALLALHACDTATDVALALAVERNARFVAVAPCCQAELARAWADAGADALGPLHAIPHFRRTMGATVTDAMRTALLEEAGYEVRAVEFVEAHHTPKNTLIYGHRVEAPVDRAAYDGLKARTGGCGIALEGWIRGASEPGTARVVLEEVDVRALVLEVAALVEGGLAAANDNRVEVRVPEVPVHATTDRRVLLQSLVDLGSNAATSATHGLLTFRLTRTTDTSDTSPDLVIQVAHAGVGIAPEPLESTRRSIERLNGELVVQSVPGQVPVVVIALPSTPPEVASIHERGAGGA